MQNYIHKSQVNDHSASNLKASGQSGNGNLFQFRDNRPEAIAQQKQQNLANNSPQAIQMKALEEMANNGLVTQLKPEVLTQTDQMYDYGDGEINVGNVMEVALDGEDMQGQSANLNSSQDDMMSAIREKWNIKGGNLVKGHLWNDNLGGSALNKNLYPITKAANSDHLGFVENAVKELAWNKQPVYYKVEVDANPDINEAKADFDCEIRSWDPKKRHIGKLLHPAITIQSDLNDVGAYGEAFETYTGQDAERHPRPRKPKWAKNPKTRVGDLTKQEYAERNNQ